MNRRILINLGVFVLVAIVGTVWAVNNIVSFDTLESPYKISAEFPASVGVKGNSEVTYLGVHYGSVTGVELTDGAVLVKMKIDRGRKIPSDSTAHALRKSAVGEPYIDFEPPKGFDPAGAKYLEPGDRVRLDHTTIPLEFSELLRSLSGVISGIDPEAAETLVHELSLAVNGRAESFRKLTVSTESLISSFAARTEQLDRLTENNTRLTHVFADQRNSLAATITNLRDLAASLRAADGDTAVLLDRGTELVGRTADVVAASKENLDCLLHDLDDVLKLLGTEEEVNGLKKALKDGPTGFNYVYATRDVEDDGVWVRVNLLTNTDEAPEAYSPPHQLPAVPTIPACVSTLSSGGVDFRGGSGGGGGIGALPATGGSIAVGGALLALGAGLTLRSLRRRAGAAA